MRKFYQTLSEKDRRRYAAIGASKLGHGGISYIAQVLGCARSTIATGVQELEALPAGSGYAPRMRHAGGGRKPYAQAIAGIDEAFLDVVQDHTAGDPMQADVLWTHLTQLNSQRLAERHTPGERDGGAPVAGQTPFHAAPSPKKETMKDVAQRDEQFEQIAELKASYAAAGNPVLSMDTKKKEAIGNFYRAGHLYTTGEIHTYDHDFTSAAEGGDSPWPL
jgi:hypothetical protein